MDRTIIPIRNMHCKSCELLIEKALLRIPGIQSVTVNFHRAEAVIHSHGTLDLERVRQAVEAEGYEVGEAEKKLWFTRDSNEYGYLAVGGLLLLVLYTLAKNTGILELSVVNGVGTDIVSAVLIGLRPREIDPQNGRYAERTKVQRGFEIRNFNYLAGVAFGEMHLEDLGKFDPYIWDEDEEA